MGADLLLLVPKLELGNEGKTHCRGSAQQSPNQGFNLTANSSAQSKLFLLPILVRILSSGVVLMAVLGSLTRTFGRGVVEAQRDR
jgi:hypothetical protein